MEAILQTASEALKQNDTEALEQLARECERLRLSPLDGAEPKITELAQVFARQVEAARQHLSLRSRLNTTSRKELFAWER